jgi:hypothetical protein
MVRSFVLPVSAVLLVGCWHLATIRAGQDWGDDFALYVSHARNLSSGAAYGDTGFIYNPAYPTYSPRTYPPVYPLLMAPVYRLFGMNFEALKIQQVMFLMLLVGVVYLSLRHEMSHPYALGVAVLLGLSPFVWLYKDRLLSEIPFMLFTCLAVYLLNGPPGEPAWRRLGLGLLAGLAIYLASGTRAIGIVLVPTAVLADVLREGRPWRLPGLLSLAVVLTFAACGAAQQALLIADGSYLNQWAFDPATPFRNFVLLTKDADKLLANGAQLSVRLAVLVPFAALFLYGYLTCLRTRVTAREIFVPAYLSAVLIWPVGGSTSRFLLPLLPFAFIYLSHAVIRLSERMGPARGRLAAVGLAAVVLVGYVGLYARMEFGQFRSGVFESEARELFDHVRERTPADAVVVFSKPRVLALFTGRRASPAHAPTSDEDLWGYLRHISATHFIVSRPFPETDAVLQRFADRHPSRLQVVFKNREFTAYRILDPDDARAEGDRGFGPGPLR